MFVCCYHFLQIPFGIVLLNGDLAKSFKSFIELVSNVPFHAVCSTNITDTADMSPTSEIADISSDRPTILTLKRLHSSTQTLFMG